MQILIMLSVCTPSSRCDESADIKMWLVCGRRCGCHAAVFHSGAALGLFDDAICKSFRDKLFVFFKFSLLLLVLAPVPTAECIKNMDKVS